MSAMFSGLTIMFLFWTITFGKKIIVKDEKGISFSQSIVILGSGLVGAMAYAFRYLLVSAVEGEVYASSSLFTAVVLAYLKVGEIK